jgi:hypothetical protein
LVLDLKNNTTFSIFIHAQATARSYYQASLAGLDYSFGMVSGVLLVIAIFVVLLEFYVHM